jgi:hypothetical protein
LPLPPSPSPPSPSVLALVTLTTLALALAALTIALALAALTLYVVHSCRNSPEFPGISRNLGSKKKELRSFFAGTSRKSQTDRAVTCKNRFLFCRNVHTQNKAKSGLVKHFFDGFAVSMLEVLHENATIKSNGGWQRWHCLSSALVGGDHI